MNKVIYGVALAALLSACSQAEDGHQNTAEMMEEVSAPAFDAMRMETALAMQSEEMQARYQYRHPKETLEFFGIAPGMTVVEALPGGGWYTKVLLPYLGAEGKVIGADYSIDMRRHFGTSEERLEARKTWKSDWVAQAEEWRGDDSATLDAFVFGSIGDEYAGAADAVVLFRAVHHLNRFDHKGGHFGIALADMKKVLKPGGVVGVVQHRAPETHDDQWANGDNGYVKQSLVVKRFTDAGFEFVGEAEINANPKDQPTEEDFVWRLPPSLGSSKEDPELRERMKAIGESDRMTLLFRKPA